MCKEVGIEEHKDGRGRPHAGGVSGSRARYREGCIQASDKTQLRYGKSNQAG